jgi:hypothetical protein
VVEINVGFTILNIIGEAVGLSGLAIFKIQIRIIYRRRIFIDKGKC